MVVMCPFRWSMELRRPQRRREVLPGWEIEGGIWRGSRGCGATRMSLGGKCTGSERRRDGGSMKSLPLRWVRVAKETGGWYVIKGGPRVVGGKYGTLRIWHLRVHPVALHMAELIRSRNYHQGIV